MVFGVFSGFAGFQLPLLRVLGDFWGILVYFADFWGILVYFVDFWGFGYSVVCGVWDGLEFGFSGLVGCLFCGFGFRGLGCGCLRVGFVGCSLLTVF